MIIGFFLSIGLDQWTKLLAVKHLMNQTPLVIWDGVFELLYSENRGAAFGMLQGKQVFFLLVALAVLSGAAFAVSRMALAAVRTGAVVTTHTTLGTLALEQAEYLKKAGVKPEKIIIGHLDLSQDSDYILSVLKEGVNIGFDTVGKNNYCPDRFRAETLKRIAKEGFLGQVVLSMDITRKSHLKKWGGLGYAYLFETFLPQLLEYGLSEEQIDMLLIDNPDRILK